MKTSKRYTSSTAQIIAKGGNVMKADIMETGELYCEKLHAIRDGIRTDYWALHGQIAGHAFDHGGEQVAAVAKLSQLGLALEAIENAYSVTNAVRCF